MGRVYGYIRVSTREQNEERQLVALRRKCIREKNIFLDKQSGKDFDRPQYKKLLEKLRPGDLPVSYTHLKRAGKRCFPAL